MEIPALATTFAHPTDPARAPSWTVTLVMEIALMDTAILTMDSAIRNRNLMAPNAPVDPVLLVSAFVLYLHRVEMVFWMLERFVITQCRLLVAQACAARGADPLTLKSVDAATSLLEMDSIHIASPRFANDSKPIQEHVFLMWLHSQDLRAETVPPTSNAMAKADA
jgi:hypothetical protein